MRTFFRKLWRKVRRPGPRPAILMYHRIASPRVDPWELAVQPDRFEQHLAVLRRTRYPLPMSEFVSRLERGTLPDKAVAVTFDDGYADNLYAAAPRLASTGVAATLFLATGFVGQRHEYWWDELARGILLRTGAVDAEVTIGSMRMSLVLGDGDERDGRWRASQEPRTERQRAYLAVWKHLRTAAPAEREDAMVQLRAVLEIPPPHRRDLPMTASEVSALARGGIFDFGGHTATHPVLPALTPAERRDDIRQGREACERLISTPISGFSYPHGALDDDSQSAVRECGFAWACCNKSRSVPARGCDAYALPRLAVLDWEGPAFERALQRLRA
jgi:peptidoglycan/xylan/chitin deacetylase (PgdA/CDA1 family)